LIAGDILEHRDLPTRFIAGNDLRRFASLLIVAERPKEEEEILARRVIKATALQKTIEDSVVPATEQDLNGYTFVFLRSHSGGIDRKP